MTSLADGLSVIGPHHHDDRLTDCACWRVSFDRYQFRPVVVVPFDTGLDAVEAFARRKMYEHLTQYGPLSHEPPETFETKWTKAVVALRVERIKRLPDVTLDPSLG